MADFVRIELGRHSVQLGVQAIPFADFDAFMRGSGRTGVRGVRRASQANPAVIGASQQDAAAYCEWVSKRVGHACRLPSMEELDALDEPGTGPRG